MDQSIITRFWGKVEKTEGCWLWRASIKPNGYGQFAVRHGEIILAHRFAYLVTKGEIPEDLYVCHTCDIRHCVNPEHLWLGTIADNNADMRQKGRRRGDGKTHPDTPELRARLLAGESPRLLALEYNRSLISLYQIRKRRGRTIRG